MPRWGRTAMLAVLTTLAVLPFAPGSAAAGPANLRPAGGETAADLARRWAPIHYQDVDATGAHALGGRADFITRVDFDGDWAGRNNWEHAATSPLPAYVYYAAVETGTHWFLTYLFFHPRDWADHPFFETEHENDTEGVLLAVERDGSAFGVLRAAVTVAHSDFYSYTPAGSTWTAGAEDVDGTLRLGRSPHDGLRHPVTAQEADGHGLKALPYADISGDGVVYQPSTVAEVPAGRDDRDVRYALLDMLAPGGLWARRADPALFARLGALAGDDVVTGWDSCGRGTVDCRTDAADAPWGWDDGDDRAAPGDFAMDPARLMAAYFTVPGPFSRTYLSNPFREPQLKS